MMRKQDHHPDLLGGNGMWAVHDDGVAIFADVSWAVRPGCVDAVEPLFDYRPESAAPRVVRRANLIRQPERFAQLGSKAVEETLRIHRLGHRNICARRHSRALSGVPVSYNAEIPE
jgi:hypothetical protein